MEKLESKNPRILRKVIETLVEKITIYGNKIEITTNFNQKNILVKTGGVEPHVLSSELVTREYAAALYRSKRTS